MKDNWDIFEIVVKSLGAVLVPGVIAYSVYSFNQQANQRTTAAQMTSIAVGILTSEVGTMTPAGDPLRLWAVDVLRNPTQITPLDDAAAKQLMIESLPASLSWDSPIFRRLNISLEDLEYTTPDAGNGDQ